MSGGGTAGGVEVQQDERYDLAGVKTVFLSRLIVSLISSSLFISFSLLFSSLFTSFFFFPSFVLLVFCYSVNLLFLVKFR